MIASAMQLQIAPLLGACIVRLRQAVECHATMTPEEKKFRLNLPPSGCRNSFSSGSDGKAIRNDLHRKDWDGSSCGLVRLRLLSNCPSVP